MKGNNNMDKIWQDEKLEGPADKERINIFESHEVKYWATKFGVTQ